MKLSLRITGLAWDLKSFTQLLWQSCSVILGRLPRAKLLAVNLILIGILA